MKKYLTTAAFFLAALLTVNAGFASVKASAKKTNVYRAEKFTTADKGTIVIDGDSTTAYDRNGQLVYTIERYHADNLPLDIFKAIRGTYGNCYIAGMEKISQPGLDTVYLVHVQDDTAYRTIRIANDDTEIIQEFLKL